MVVFWLVSLQTAENINFGNKVRKYHVEYESNKMNVRLAAETLSDSTAASIEYLNTVKKIENFHNIESNVEYFRFNNNIFDIMNTKRSHCNDKYKQPISDKTINQTQTYFEYAKQYIKGLQIIENTRMKPILKSNSFTPFFGFYHNMISFMGIYHDYVEPTINEFYTFDVSQDHLESFFGCIRRMGGSILIRFLYSSSQMISNYFPSQVVMTIRLLSNLWVDIENYCYTMK